MAYLSILDKVPEGARGIKKKLVYPLVFLKMSANLVLSFEPAIANINISEELYYMH